MTHQEHPFLPCQGCANAGGGGQGGHPSGEISPLCQAWESENQHGVLHVAKNHKPLAEVLPRPPLEREQKHHTGVPASVSSELSAGSWGATSPCPAPLGADSSGGNRAGQLQAGLGVNSQGKGEKSLAGSPQQHHSVGSLHQSQKSQVKPSQESQVRQPQQSQAKSTFARSLTAPARSESCPEKQIVRNAITQACSLISLDQSHGDFCTWLSQSQCCPPQFSPQVLVVAWSWPGHPLVVNPA